MTFNKKRYSQTLLLAALVSLLISALFFIFFSLPFFFNGYELSLISTLPLLLSLLIFSLSFLFLTRKVRKRKSLCEEPIPAGWDTILSREVAYYSTLNEAEKRDFKRQLLIFLGEKSIKGIEITVDEKCRLLVAASAVIPVFNYKDWEYEELSEILIYPDNFNENFEFNGTDNNILGMVINNGTTMILSISSLLDSFRNDKDRLNVGFHEFAHKIDGEDGYIDGLPALMLERSLHKQWIEVVKRESALIEEGKSDINPYALTNSAEFFAVVTEYFFENPSIMEEKHNELYELLKAIYKQDTKSRFEGLVKSMFRPYAKKTGRNSPCPCGSGKKYKKCCLNKVK